MPFNTQFFHDDDDDVPGFDDGFDGDLAGTADPGEQDLLADTQGRTKRVRPQFVNYTKRAKRVDVRKLKENIWRGLKIPTPEQQPADAEVMVRLARCICVFDSFLAHFEKKTPRFAEQDFDEETPSATNPKEARTFDDVIVGLQRSYPEDKLAEISTSFCFICLLHLANERGLKLEAGDVEQTTIPEAEENDKVGNIWGLKVGPKFLTYVVES
jgi:condensin complex subunit 2